ncbi:transcriptional regulator [Halogeometricum borinquense DSM 11551]|uniref:Transcriptional regulator n=1 Tax=Halogeometricum borinquense (strain ATCC 700274 / DSM 11551 / JCM 10706 / KCTC 4070 / PR3) TaxID=469382 RepID=E4NUN8_HALBP|nr:TetR/AcrR family transcriptional regulator [Halogeometricum borinquense]ADQ68758.1 transcriptional regulator [Halogeometricum borinquense DSM 11551]ELY25681.1 transcriptional regulator [Halogeometricum borinquense DSM 11551]
MPTTSPFLDSPGGTREEIIRATYLALCEYGYADLTIQRIGEQFPKSKSLIYHHYDGKDELLLDFLEFALDRFEGLVPFDDADSAGEHLDSILDHVLATPLSPERRQFATAIVELRGQAAHNPRYRDHFTCHDQFFHDQIAAIIEAGIEDGEFNAVSADVFAWFLVTVINGAMTQRVTSDADTTAMVRAQIDRCIGTVVAGAR